MRAGATVALLLLAALAGCFGPETPKVVLEDLFSQTEATYRTDSGAYEVHVVARVANHGSVQARGISVVMGIGDGCLDRPPLDARFDIEALAPASSAPLQDEFTQASPPLRRTALWYEVRVGDPRTVTDHGCDALRGERAPG